MPSSSGSTLFPTSPVASGCGRSSAVPIMPAVTISVGLGVSIMPSSSGGAAPATAPAAGGAPSQTTPIPRSRATLRKHSPSSLSPRDSRDRSTDGGSNPADEGSPSRSASNSARARGDVPSPPPGGQPAADQSETTSAYSSGSSRPSPSASAERTSSRHHDSPWGAGVGAPSTTLTGSTDAFPRVPREIHRLIAVPTSIMTNTMRMLYLTQHGLLSTPFVPSPSPSSPGSSMTAS
mmetsp:Transcript_26302/g.62452  ORF Transcript_26302/g.62452 Transcript_26302/m.62452 type:complete len:235 (+) Transcript_26302:1003-1707(+)